MGLVGRQPLIVGISAALLVVSTVSTVVRFLSRRLRAGFWWDDWCSLLATVRSYIPAQDISNGYRSLINRLVNSSFRIR